jgi:hypothetical protein
MAFSLAIELLNIRARRNADQRNAKLASAGAGEMGE